jgi:hypothetical protein
MFIARDEGYLQTSSTTNNWHQHDITEVSQHTERLSHLHDWWTFIQAPGRYSHFSLVLFDMFKLLRYDS